MIDLLLLLAPVFFVAGLLFTAASLYLHHRMLRTLSMRHATVWRGLGSPTLFSNNSISNSRALRQFIKKKSYIQLGDVELQQIIRNIKVLDRLHTVDMLLLGASFIAMLMSS